MPGGVRFKAATRAQLRRKTTPGGGQVLRVNPALRIRKTIVPGRIKGVLSPNVHEVWYEHFEDGKWYYHVFDPAVLMAAVEQYDGQRDILLTGRDGQALWEDF